jgi:opacity protein-like surface antigen
MRTFKQFVGSLCFLLTFFGGLALLASPLSFAKGSSSSGSAAGIQVGQVWPAGVIGESVDNAIVPGLFYEYQSGEAFGLKVDWIRARHPNDRLAIDTFSAAIKANIIYYDQLIPYAFFGMGMYLVDKMVPITNEDASKTLFGMNFGFGLDLDLSSMAFVGMQFGVHNIFSGNATVPSGIYELSGRYSSFLMRAGIRF